MSSRLPRLIVTGRDTWTETKLDALESAAKGTITSRQEDGRGGMTFVIQCWCRFRAAERKAILEAVQAIEPRARWMA